MKKKRDAMVQALRSAGGAHGDRPKCDGGSGDAAAAPRFVHLRVHSAYSLLEGALPLKTIIGSAVKDHQPAIAITDTNNLFAALEFSVKSIEAGVQPIIGCQLEIDMEDAGEEERPSQRSAALANHPSLVLLAASEAGYRRLVDLVSRAYLGADLDADPDRPCDGHPVLDDGDAATPATAATKDRDARPQGPSSPSHSSLSTPLAPGGMRTRIALSWLSETPHGTDGLIALTGARTGPVDLALRDGQPARAVRRLEQLKAIFSDRLYVELQRHGDGDRAHENRMLELAYRHDLPIVATNEAFFPSRDDYEAHDALLAVAHNTILSDDSRFHLTPDHALKTQAEMASLFADLPEALDNTIEIARRCSFLLSTRAPILPRFTASKSADEDEALRAEALELRRQAEDGLAARLAAGMCAPGHDAADYRNRLKLELDIIESMGFPGYFLIVADFIKWAKSNGIPVGPGRGSGAGSLVAYALTITDVDPLRFSLLFERFLNPERVSMPDFDIDFCQDRRDEVIRYVQEKYGRSQVAQIITFGSLQARAALRDVGRVLEMPYGQVDRICKLVPNNPASPTPLARAIEEEPRLREEAEREPVVARLLDIAQKIEGLYRHASTHAAGLVIGDRPLTQLVPMYRDPRSDMPVTQFNMKWVEQAGLVKFDFLGLKTLTVLNMASAFLAARGISIDLANLPLDDADTYRMLSRGETVGIFQIESAGMRKALLGMRPDRIEDIIALVALYRPGPMENIPVYNARKHHEEVPASIHPKIDHLLRETQGVIVYQEQVMQIAQELSGYSLGEADLLRRAMGKKIKAEMDQQRTRFVDGAVERGVERAQANTIFDLLAKFANYGFNKSHAAAYALVSYQTAYLKAHHPVEFLAASMTLDMTNTDKINDFCRDAQRLGIEVVAPCVRTSFRHFEPGENRIYYALSAIKGVGEAAVDHIVAERGNRPFVTIEDFCERIDPRIVNRRVFEGLIAAGAFDCFGHERAQLTEGIDRLMGFAQRASENRSSGQSDMFALADDRAAQSIQFAACADWLPGEKLHREFQALGFYMSAHPLDSYKSVLKRMKVQNYQDFVRAVKAGATAGRLAGTVISRQERKTRTGNRMGIVTLSDATGQFEAVMFSEALSRYRDLLEPGAAVVLTVSADERPEGLSLRIQTVTALDDTAAQQQSSMRVYMRDKTPLDALLARLSEHGEAQVSVIVIKDGGAREIEIELAERYRVSPQIAAALKAAAGIVEVRLF